MNDLEYRRRQLHQLQNEVVDIDELAGGISITDMTLNDFRMDLAEYLKQHAQRLEHMPPNVVNRGRCDRCISAYSRESCIATQGVVVPSSCGAIHHEENLVSELQTGA